MPLKSIRVPALMSLALVPAVLADPVPPSDDLEELAEYFFRQPLYEEVRISPDGAAVAYTFNEGEDSGIRFIQFSTDKTFNLENSEGVYVKEFEWVDEDMLIYILQGERQSHPQVNTVTLKRFKPDEVIPEGERHRRRRGAMSIVDPLPSVKGKVLAWRGEDVGSELLMLDPKTDETPIIAPNDGSIAKWFNDETGTLWMAAGRNPDNGRADIFLRFDPSRKTFEEIESLHGSRTDVLAITDRGQSALIITDLGAETKGLAQFDIAAGALTGDTIRDPRFDFSDPQPIYVPHLKAVIGAHVDLHTPSTLWFNPQLEQFQKLIDASMPERRYNEVLAFHPDGVTVFVRSFSDTFPDELVKIDLKERRIEPVLRKRPWIDHQAMARTRFIAIPAAEGKSIYGYMTLPSDDSKNLPLIINLRIGPDKRAYHEFDAEAQFYAAQGFAHLLLLPRGSTGFGKSYHGGDESPRAFMAKHVADDAAAAANWAIGEGIARKGAIGLIGDGPFGGFSALSCAVRHPDLFTAVASSARNFELRDVLHRKWDSSALQDDSFINEFSPMERLDNAEASFFLMNFPSRDRASNAEKLEDALAGAGKTVERKEFPREFKRRDLPRTLALNYAKFMRAKLMDKK